MKKSYLISGNYGDQREGEFLFGVYAHGELECILGDDTLHAVGDSFYKEILKVKKRRTIKTVIKINDGKCIDVLMFLWRPLHFGEVSTELMRGFVIKKTDEKSKKYAKKHKKRLSFCI